MVTTTFLAHTHRGLRACQLVACAIAFGSTASSFGVTHSSGFSYRLGSPATNLHLLTTYTAVLYTGWFMACVELLALAPRPRMATMRILDSVHAAMLVIAGLVFKTSDYVTHCDNYGSMLACRGFDTAVASTVVAIVLFVATIALTYVKSSGENALEAPPVGYMVESTPTAAVVCSPQVVVNDAPTPSTKV